MPDQHMLGKKVFFLYPPPVLSEIAEELAKGEFEVYLVNDHRKLRRMLSSHGRAVLYINIDSVPEGTQWEYFVLGIMSDSGCRDVGVGVMTMSDADSASREKYISRMQVPCGYIVLKNGAAQAVERLTKILDANEARGKRQHVRAICPPNSGRCNAEVGGRMAYADILDISSSGLAAVFEGGSSAREGAVLKKLSIRVKGVRLMVDGFIAMQRPNRSGSIVSVVIFLPDSLDAQRAEKLKILVYRLNQEAMDQRLLAMG